MQLHSSQFAENYRSALNDTNIQLEVIQQIQRALFIASHFRKVYWVKLVRNCSRKEIKNFDQTQAVMSWKIKLCWNFLPSVFCGDAKVLNGNIVLLKVKIFGSIRINVWIVWIVWNWFLDLLKNLARKWTSEVGNFFNLYSNIVL